MNQPTHPIFLLYNAVVDHWGGDRLTHGQRETLHVYIRCVNADWIAWPSPKFVAAKTGKSVRTAERMTRELVAIGWLENISRLGRPKAGEIKSRQRRLRIPPRPTQDGGLTDAGPDNSATQDGGLTNAGPDNSATQDGGLTNAGPDNSATQDGGLTNAGPDNSATQDGGLTDAGPDNSAKSGVKSAKNGQISPPCWLADELHIEQNIRTTTENAVVVGMRDLLGMREAGIREIMERVPDFNVADVQTYQAIAQAGGLKNPAGFLLSSIREMGRRYLLQIRAHAERLAGSLAATQRAQSAAEQEVVERRNVKAAQELEATASFERVEAALAGLNAAQLEVLKTECVADLQQRGLSDVASLLSRSDPTVGRTIRVRMAEFLAEQAVSLTSQN